MVGSEVVVVKNGRRICGTGAALANVPIVQNKAYFEVKLQCTGKSCTLSISYDRPQQTDHQFTQVFLGQISRP